MCVPAVETNSRTGALLDTLSGDVVITNQFLGLPNKQLSYAVFTHSLKKTNTILIVIFFIHFFIQFSIHFINNTLCFVFSRISFIYFNYFMIFGFVSILYHCLSYEFKYIYFVHLFSFQLISLNKIILTLKTCTSREKIDKMYLLFFFFFWIDTIK